MIKAQGRYRIRKYKDCDPYLTNCFQDTGWNNNIVTDHFRRELAADNSVLTALRLWIGQEELGIHEMYTMIPNVYTATLPDSVSFSGLITTYTALITPDPMSTRDVRSVGLSLAGSTNNDWILGVCAYQNLAQVVNQATDENLLLEYQLEYII